MQGVRITFKHLSFGSSNYEPLLPGEPVFDPVDKRIGVGIGANAPIWFPRATPEGNLEFDPDQGLVSEDGTMTLSFQLTGLSWKVSGNEVFATREDDGIGVRSAVMFRNQAGVDTVVMGYGHYMAMMAMLFKLKALLRKLVNNTAINADVDALMNPDPAINYVTLDPAFPEKASL